ncbi:MAG TPA: lipid-A-disaccharide synthase, partial [Desulfosalsimonadaceae bacterium]|nr:lipid-A-disaccharide synthase [Desulfosalsimonadaceae bacterium]
HQLSVVGITEVAGKIPRVLTAVSAVKRSLDRLQPDLVVLIDFPDFNLHIAKLAKKKGLPVLYYISPQIWAWRSGRIAKIRRYVDQMAVILPFEEAYYRSRGVAATFVGHPLLDYCQDLPQQRPEPPSREAVVGIMPGSRAGEIAKNLPVMLAAATRIRAAVSGVRFRISVAPGIDRQWVSELVRPYLEGGCMEVAAGPVQDVFAASTLILAASGTVTLETAIFGVPMIVIYRVSPVSYYLGRALVHVEHIGLVNIIAGRRIVPELVQDAASPAGIAGEAVSLLQDPERLREIRQALADVRRRLGSPGAADRCAAIACRMLQ